MIGIKNTLDETIKGRYDGQDYEFRTGQTVALPEEAARHIFGYGVDDKSRALIRLGWVANSTGMEAAMAKLDGIKFLAEKEVVFEEPEEEQAMQTAAPPPGTGIDIPTLKTAVGKK